MLVVVVLVPMLLLFPVPKLKLELEPVLGLVLGIGLGVGTGIIGLTPALFNCVASSPIPLPRRDGTAGDDDDPLSVEDDPEYAAVQPPDVVVPEPIPVVPPPSKVEFDIPVVPLPIPEDAELQGDTAGLRPLGLSSVAPRPIPAPVDPLGNEPPGSVGVLEPGTPSGEVAPIAGEVAPIAGEVVPIPEVPYALCAAATPQLNRNATVIAVKRRIEISFSVLELSLLDPDQALDRSR